MGLLEEEACEFNAPAERSTGFFQKETPSHAPLCSLPHHFIFFFLLSFILLCPVVTGALWERYSSLKDRKAHSFACSSCISYH